MLESYAEAGRNKFLVDPLEGANYVDLSELPIVKEFVKSIEGNQCVSNIFTNSKNTVPNDCYYCLDHDVPERLYDEVSAFIKKGITPHGLYEIIGRVVETHISNITSRLKAYDGKSVVYFYPCIDMIELAGEKAKPLYMFLTMKDGKLIIESETTFRICKA